MKLPTTDGPKTSLKGNDIVAAMFGAKNKDHVVLFANATQIELVSVFSYRKYENTAYFIDIRQRLSPKDSELLLMTLFDALGYDVQGMHSYSTTGARVTEDPLIETRFCRKTRQRFGRKMHPICLHVDPPEIGVWDVLPPSLMLDVAVSQTRARQLAAEMADLMGWDLR